MISFNEYSKIIEVAIRNPQSSFISEKKLLSEWQDLRFHSKPDFKKAIYEFKLFRELLEDDGIKIIDLPSSPNLTIDSIYTRDSILVCKKGLILCNMGRSSRTPEALICSVFSANFIRIANSISCFLIVYCVVFYRFFVAFLLYH